MPEPAIEQTNSAYHGFSMNTDNVIFINSIEDPWQWTAMRHLEDKWTQTNMSTLIVDADGCAHCSDLGYAVDQP